MRNIYAVCFIVGTMATACAGMHANDKDDARHALDRMAEKTIAALVNKNPSLQQSINESLAYAVMDVKLTKVPVVGAGSGKGVLYIKKDQQRKYLTAKRFDLGGGWGVRSYKVLMLFASQDVLDDWKDGKWMFEIGAEASAGSASASADTSGPDQGFSLHVLAEGGASATARVIHIKVNKALSDESSAIVGY